MKKVISFAMSMMLGASLLYGCTSGTASTSLQSEETASSSSSASDSTEEESCMIGMSVPSMNNPYFIYIEDIIKSKVEANGDTFVSFDPQYDPMKQISQIEDMITQGIDVLILCPYDSQGIRPALEACKEKGVLVVNFDNRVMDALSEQGVSIIMISSELPEIIGMCDRIYVMSGGRVTGELNRGAFSQETIMNYATGGK